MQSALEASGMRTGDASIMDMQAELFDVLYK
jgi:hypothetical protein